MIYYITRYTGNTKDAGTKAPNDIESICKRNGWKETKFIKPSNNSNNLVEKIKKIAKIMEKFIENHLSFFTKKENKENQTDF